LLAPNVKANFPVKLGTGDLYWNVGLDVLKSPTNLIVGPTKHSKDSSSFRSQRPKRSGSKLAEI
jgi:hypothetical protein